MDVANHFRESLKRLASSLKEPVRLMEVCGSHTMAIARFGIRGFLPETVHLVSGPGCPVCVTSEGFLDGAIELAKQGHVIVTFGDMMRVPASRSNLTEVRSEGGWIEVCYTPMEALVLARRFPDKEIVFLAVGFETTTAPAIAMLDRALREGVGNLSLLTAFKRIPPALKALAMDPEIRIDGFLCPAHVSAIIGSDAYLPFANDHHLACVVAGFEPLDILYGLEGLLKQLAAGDCRVENQYDRVVRSHGNPLAQSIMERFLLPLDAHWRGLGIIPESGLALREDFASFDAARRHGITLQNGEPHPGCRCGDVLKGIIQPDECRLFGKICQPESPLGPCMVSSEGSCAAHFKYSLRDPS